MKEIKFRGIRIKTNEWVYGYLVKREPIGPEEPGHDIVIPIGMTSSVTYLIRQGTEGQYTGLKDIGKKEIYEKDIIKHNEGIGVVYYNEAETTYFVKNKDGTYIVLGLTCGREVIGNTIDNPELMEGYDG